MKTTQWFCVTFLTTSLAFCLLGCGKAGNTIATSNGTAGGTTPKKLATEITAEGKIKAELTYVPPHRLINCNYLITDDTAYFLVFIGYDCSVVGLDRQKGGGGLQIAAPVNLGIITVYPEATYLVRGRIVDTATLSATYSSPTLFDVSESEIARRIAARLSEPNFAKLDKSSQEAAVREPEDLAYRVSQMEPMHSGRPTKYLRVTYFELKTPEPGHEKQSPTSGKTGGLKK